MAGNSEAHLRQTRGGLTGSESQDRSSQASRSKGQANSIARGKCVARTTHLESQQRDHRDATLVRWRMLALVVTDRRPADEPGRSRRQEIGDRHRSSQADVVVRATAKHTHKQRSLGCPLPPISATYTQCSPLPPQPVPVSLALLTSIYHRHSVAIVLSLLSLFAWKQLVTGRGNGHSSGGGSFLHGFLKLCSNNRPICSMPSSACILKMCRWLTKATAA